MNNNVVMQNIDIDAVMGNIKRFTVETPSWGYGNSGTRLSLPDAVRCGAGAPRAESPVPALRLIPRCATTCPSVRTRILISVHSDQLAA